MTAYPPPPPSAPPPQPVYGVPAPMPAYGAPPQQIIIVQAPPAPERSSLPTFAGVMLILGAIGGFIMGLLAFSAISLVAGVTGPSTPGYADFVAKVSLCGGIMLLGAIMAILSAILCFMRKNWPIAVVGALLATVMPGLGPATLLAGVPAAFAGLLGTIFLWGFLIGGGLFGMIGLILVLVSKKHFKVAGQP